MPIVNQQQELEVPIMQVIDTPKLGLFGIATVVVGSKENDLPRIIRFEKSGKRLVQFRAQAGTAGWLTCKLWVDADVDDALLEAAMADIAGGSTVSFEARLRRESWEADGEQRAMLTLHGDFAVDFAV